MMALGGSEIEAQTQVISIDRALTRTEERSLAFFSDGSGGKFSAQPDLRRCGWAWVLLDQYHDLSFARSASLEGERQTVPRAELAAVLDAMRTLPKAVRLEAVVDASYVVKNGTQIAKKLDAALRISKEHADGVMASIEQIYGCNGDLWAEFARIYVER